MAAATRARHAQAGHHERDVRNRERGAASRATAGYLARSKTESGVVVVGALAIAVGRGLVYLGVQAFAILQ